jgi:hypothetical protein
MADLCGPDIALHLALKFFYDTLQACLNLDLNLFLNLNSNLNLILTLKRLLGKPSTAIVLSIAIVLSMAIHTTYWQ